MVRFSCQRCHFTHIEPLDLHADETKESYGHLHDIKPPKDWREIPYNTLLCPSCAREYDAFMNKYRAPKMCKEADT